MYHIKCPNCKGKGHVFDASTLAFFGLGFLLGPIQTKDKGGFTRKICEHCNGTGYIKIEGEIRDR